MIASSRPRSQAEIDAGLSACIKLVLTGLYGVCFGLLLFCLGFVRLAGGIVTLALAGVSFVLWSLTVWQHGIEDLLRGDR